MPTLRSGKKDNKGRERKLTANAEPLIDGNLKDRILKGTYEERKFAIKEAERERDRTVVEELIATLLIKSDSEASSMERVELSFFAADAIGTIGLDEGQFQRLMDLAMGGEKHEKDSAVRGLASTGDVRAIPTIISVLESGDADSRSNAAYALGDFSDDQALKALIKTLYDEDHFISEAAYSSITKQEDRTIRSILPDLMDAVMQHGYFDEVYECVEMIVELATDDQWESLVEVLKNGSHGQKAGAALILGYAKYTDAKPLMIEALRDKLDECKDHRPQTKADETHIEFLLCAINEIGHSRTREEIEGIWQSLDKDIFSHRIINIVEDTLDRLEMESTTN